jgi:hypothetical protein
MQYTNANANAASVGMAMMGRSSCLSGRSGDASPHALNYD